MGTVRHPTSCKAYTVRYQWIAEMCGNKRTEADIVGILMGYTNAQYDARKGTSDAWEWVSLSLPYLAATTSESVRTVQRAMQWLREHEVVEIRGPDGDQWKKSYRLNMKLLDRVAEARDRENGPVHLVRFAGTRCVSIQPGIPKKR